MLTLTQLTIVQRFMWVSKWINTNRYDCIIKVRRNAWNVSTAMGMLSLNRITYIHLRNIKDIFEMRTVGQSLSFKILFNIYYLFIFNKNNQ